MSDASKIERLIQIMSLVQGDPTWTPARLSEHFGVAQRTVHRYVDALQGAGVPITFDRGRGGYIIGEGYFLPPVHLTVEEALAIAALCRNVASPDQIAFMEPAARALAKISARFPDDVREEVDEAADAMVIRTSSTGPADAFADVYDTMRRAIAERRALVCRYEAAHGTGDPGEEFDFEPYALLFNVRAWYAVGHHGGRDAMRTLKLSRFAKATLTARMYEIPENWSLDAHLGNAWQMINGTPEYNVVIEFDADFAETLADTRWHRTQEIDEHPDGSLTFRCTVAGLDEIIYWVLSMGSSCRVVEPPELVDRVREMASKTLARYADG
ncbi:MAG: helix-turn-helix transcriptional regulator [Phycisphaerales bacterium]